MLELERHPPAEAGSTSQDAPAGSVAASGTGAPAPRPWLTELLWAAGAGLLALVAVALDLRLWDANLRVPLGGAGGDTNLAITTVKGMLEHGWIFSNPDVGAPAGTKFYDFPAGFGDILHFLIMRGLALGSDDPVAVVNAFYVLGYPLVAASAYAVLRALGASRGVALVLGVLYALLPFHLLRGESHLTLSAYYAVPLSCWLILGGMGVHPLVARRAGDARGVRGWLSRRTLTTLALAVVAGLATTYYALFAVVLLALTAPVAYLAHRNRSVLAGAGVALVTIFAVSVACQLPAVLYQQANGPNRAVAERQSAESEIYGLKLTHLVLPRPGHRVDALSDLGERYGQNPLPAEGFSPSLGFLLVLGLGFAVVSVMTGGLRTAFAERRALVPAAGLASLITFLMATVGGGSALFAYIVSSQIRAWNRISVFLAFFALVGLMVLLMRLRERFAARPGWIFGVVLAAVGVLGLLDQTSSRDRPDYAGAEAVWSGDARFVAAIEARTGPGAMILQLPFVPFPENPAVNDMADYDLFKGYSHSRDLRWSYGQVKGRPVDWNEEAAALPTDELIYSAAAAGFAGVYLDNAGFADQGQDIRGQLETLIGPEKIGSQDGRLAFYPLDRLAAAAREQAGPRALAEAGQALVAPITPVFEEGFQAAEPDAAGLSYRAGSDATVRLVNRSDRPRRIRLTGGLVGTDAVRPTLVQVTIGDGPTRTFATDAAGTPTSLNAEVTIPPGGVDLRLRTQGPPDGNPADPVYRVRLVGLGARDPATTRLDRLLSR